MYSLIAGRKNCKISKTVRMTRIRSHARNLIRLQGMSGLHKEPEQIQTILKDLQELAPNQKSSVIPVTFYTVQIDGVLIMQLKDQDIATEISKELNKIIGK